MHIHQVIANIAININIPGTTPPKKSCPTETLTIAPKRTKEIEGGTIGPTVAADAITALENAGLKPRFFISGSKTVPVAAASASAEPEHPDIIKFAVTPTLANPPLRCPTSVEAKPTILRVTPVTFISSPAKMNNGIANKTKEFTPEVICCAKRTIGVKFSVNCAKVRYPNAANPIAQAISMPSKEKINNMAIMETRSILGLLGDG